MYDLHMKKMQLPSGKALSIPELEVAIVLAQTIYKDITNEDYIDSLKQELAVKKDSITR